MALRSLPLPPPLPHSLGAPGSLGSGKKNSLFPPNQNAPSLCFHSKLSARPPVRCPPVRVRCRRHRLTGARRWDMGEGRFGGGYGRSCLWSALPPSLSLLLSLAGRQALACSSLLLHEPCPLPSCPAQPSPSCLLFSPPPARSLMAPLTSCWCWWPPPGRRGDRFENGTVLAGKPAFVGPAPPPPSIPPSLARPLLFPQL